MEGKGTREKEKGKEGRGLREKKKGGRKEVCLGCEATCCYPSLAVIPFPFPLPLRRGWRNDQCGGVGAGNTPNRTFVVVEGGLFGTLDAGLYQGCLALDLSFWLVE